MEIINQSTSGTLESSDIQIILGPNKQGIDIDIRSSVQKQFGEHIDMLIRKILSDKMIEHAKVLVVDNGALDCTIRARMETAIYRSIEGNQRVEWGVIK
ncbi:citrate lyase acyl carrier protein [Amphibacillus cookii]|uniref:citrate lyase acyl carrier protein n=1 Tax=Amphibacillus cookii TaxID=767787 RepID=UPI00195DDDAD|nr:citrate lyase acyl carrier protein [Amphibacillus cookii]MBM7540200.1 citrate lyase subunit gamma (acyl carrier protein) [Amphibacillus cookii]